MESWKAGAPESWSSAGALESWTRKASELTGILFLSRSKENLEREWLLWRDEPNWNRCDKSDPKDRREPRILGCEEASLKLARRMFETTGHYLTANVIPSQGSFYLAIVKTHTEPFCHIGSDQDDPTTKTLRQGWSKRNETASR